MHYDVDTDESVDSYKDPYGTDTEALEKVGYDGTTVTLTVDGKYGQDKIEIDDAATPSGQSTVTLPAGTYSDGYATFTIDNDITFTVSSDGHFHINENFLDHDGRACVLMIDGDDTDLNTAYVQIELEPHSVYSMNVLEHIVVSEIPSTPMPDKLPFVLSFTTGGYSWDKTMNDTVWNSWGSERG